MFIYFWESWCDLCSSEQPDLNALAARYPGVDFVGDDVRDFVASARAYALALNVPYPSVYDQLAVDARSFLVQAIPTTIVVNSKGEIVGRYACTVSRIAQQLDALLSQGA